MRTVESTGRISRWRGQIVHICSILAVNLRDRGMDEPGKDSIWRTRLQDQLKEVFALLGQQCEEVKTEEYSALVQMDERIFTPLVSTSA
jgi:hypothetical protein